MNRFLPCLAVLALLAPHTASAAKPSSSKSFDTTGNVVELIKKLTVKPKDWPQWGGTYHRNNTPDGQNIPIEWDLKTGENILWAVPLGSQTYGNPVVANGKVYVGTNNGYGYLKRYPKTVDLGCLLCFEEATGKFLWQASSPKLPAGRVNDWPQQGICSTVYAEDKRVWYVSSRGEVLCLDSEGFHDGTNNGPFLAEANNNEDEADVIWRYDLMGTLGVFQHNMCSCSVTCVGDLLFVNTSNGVDDAHLVIPAPKAPSFLCMNRNTGEVLWTDGSPGTNILHGQWSSPLYFETEGQAQVVFGGGDGWIYSFDPKGDKGKKSKLLWKFDANPKESFYVLGGRATRNHIIGTPVFYDGNVYVAVGEDPEHGEGQGHLWCLDPNKRGDISPTKVINRKTREEIPHRRLQAYFEFEPLFKWDKKTEVPPAMDALAKGELTEPLTAEFKKKGVALPEKFEAKKESETKKKVGGKERITNQTWILTAGAGDDEQKWKIEIDSNSIRASVRTDEEEVPNANSAVVWHYDAVDRNGNKKFDFEEIMHRSIGSVAIKDDLCFISDFSGLIHCVDAKKTDENGRPVVYWTKDMFDASWGSVLIVDDKVYVGDEAGDVLIFDLSKEMKMLNDSGDGSGANIGSAVYSTPVVANDTLFISNKSMLFAIKQGAKLEGGVKPNTAAETGDAE